jgi:lipopolysaccharide transport system ATP-binding protein
MIELDSVTKVYGGRPSLSAWWDRVTGRARPDPPALSDVSFAVGRGETMGILGGNGSGKSTLLKIVAGLLSPTGGRVRVEGRVAALVELGAGFDPDYTGRQNIELAGTLLGLTPDRIRTRAGAIADFSGLGSDIERPVRTYSAGMFMRLAFAVATSVDADVLAIDEVLAVGDAPFQARCRETLQEFRRRGGTLLLVSHDPGVLAAWCPRVLWLDRGRARAIGMPDAVLREYFVSTAATAATAAGGGDPGDVGRDSRGSGAARLREASLTGSDGVPRRVFRTGEALHVHVTFDVKRSVPRPVVGVMVSREDWVCCFAASSLDDGPAPAAQAEGAGAAVLSLDPLQLTPGRYFISASISSAPRPPASRVLDYVLRLASFEVVGECAPAGIFRPHQRWTLGPARGPDVAAAAAMIGSPARVDPDA